MKRWELWFEDFQKENPEGSNIKEAYLAGIEKLIDFNEGMFCPGCGISGPYDKVTIEKCDKCATDIQVAISFSRAFGDRVYCETCFNNVKVNL